MMGQGRLAQVSIVFVVFSRNVRALFCKEFLPVLPDTSAFSRNSRK